MEGIQDAVFSLEEASRQLAPRGGRRGTIERVHYHIQTGRLRLVARGIYAVVPLGMKPATLSVDPFLVGAATRPDAVFSHHSALELLGAAHSVWSECTLYTSRRRRPVILGDAAVRFLQPPAAMRRGENEVFATRRVERRGRMPVAPQYLERNRRGGRWDRRWNLIVPAEIEHLGGPDEP